MSGSFGTYSPWTERQLEEERALLAKASANWVGEIVGRWQTGALDRDAAVELLDILGLLPEDTAEAAVDGPTSPSVGVDTPEPAETISGRRCGVCGRGLKHGQDRFCGIPCYRKSRAPSHGTRYMATLHRRDREQPCGPCHEAELAYKRASKARSRERAAS